MGLEEFNAAYEYYAVANADAPLQMEVLWHLPEIMSQMYTEYFTDSNHHPAVQGTFWGGFVVASYLAAFFGIIGTWYTVNGVYVFIYSFYWCHRGSDYY